MRYTLKQFFVPHEHNAYHPHILHSKRVIFYGTLGIVVKGIAVITALLLPLQVFVMPEVLSIQEERVMELTNQVREREGIPPIFKEIRLGYSSFDKARDMSIKGYFEHVSPDGKRLRDFLYDAGYEFSVAGENLAVGFSTPETMVRAWVNSPTHFANLIDPEYQHIGVGMSPGVYQAHPAMYVAQHFGNPRAFDPDTIALTVGSTPHVGDPRVRGAVVRTDSDPGIVGGPYYDQDVSYLAWKSSGHTIELTAFVRVVGEVSEVSVEAHGYQFSLYPTDDVSIWSGSIAVYREVADFFQVVLTPSIEIRWADGERTLAGLQWQYTPIIPPTLTTKYELSRLLPGVFGYFSSVSYGVLYAMVILFSCALACKIFIEIRRQHLHVIGSTLALIALLTLLAIV